MPEQATLTMILDRINEVGQRVEAVDAKLDAVQGNMRSVQSKLDVMGGDLNRLQMDLEQAKATNVKQAEEIQALRDRLTKVEAKQPYTMGVGATGGAMGLGALIKMLLGGG